MDGNWNAGSEASKAFLPNWNLKDVCVCVYLRSHVYYKNASQWAICAWVTILSRNSQNMDSESLTQMQTLLTED